MLTINHKSISIIVIVILFFCNISIAQNAAKGLTIDEIEMELGTLKLFRTSHFPKGENISGTLQFLAKSEKLQKQQKQIQEFEKYVVKLGDKSISKKGFFQLQLPQKQNVAFQIFDKNGALVHQSVFALDEPARSVSTKLPKTIRPNSSEKIIGDFSRQANLPEVKLNEKPLEILAANESELFVETGNIQAGKQDLSLNYDDKTYQEKVNVVDYTLNADRLTLERGETANLTIEILGLEGLQDTLLFDIENESTATVSIENGNKQSFEILPEEVFEVKQLQKKFEIISLRRGSYTIKTNLEIVPVAEEILDEITTNTPTKEPAKPIITEPDELPDTQWDFINYLNGIPEFVEEPGEKSFHDETLNPCDTLIVNFRIRSEIKLISQQICHLSSAKLDSVFDALDQLEKATWEKDSLQGIINVAHNFKNRLNQLKLKSTGKYQQQIIELENLENNSSSCYPNWESDFYNRYIKPYPASNQRQSIYNSYVDRYKRNFENCVSRTKNRLEREKNEQENRFDKSYLNEIEAHIVLLENRLQNAEQKRRMAEQNLLNELRKLMQSLCQINVKWNALLSYMDANMICLTCGEVYFSKPPELNLMDSCLSDFTSRLMARIANLRNPHDVKNMSNVANAYFNLNEMDKNIEKLDSLNQAFNLVLGNGGKVKMVHPCCERLVELASGVFLVHHQVKSYSEMSAAAKQYGLGNLGLIPVPENPGSYTNRNYKNEYRKDRRALLTQAFSIKSEMERTLRRLKNGSNGGDNSSQHGLKDPKAMMLHGAVNAVPIHLQSQADLQKLLQNFIAQMGNCYNQSIQNSRQRTYTQVKHRCFQFKLCLELLDKFNDDYQNKRDSIVQSLNTRINHLKQNAEQLKQELASLQSLINDLNGQINQAGNNEVVNGNQNLKNDIEEVKEERNRLVRQKQNLDGLLSSLQSRIALMEQRLNNLGGRIEPRPVASIEECDRLRNQIQQIVNRFNANNQQMEGQLVEAERQAQAIAEGTSSTFEDTGELVRNTDNIENRIGDIEAEIERQNKIRASQKQMEEKARCFRLLSEYWDRQHSEFSPLDSLAAAYETFAGYLGNVPEGYSDIIDKLNDFNSRVADVQERVQQLSNLLNGVMGQPTDSARAAAFGTVLQLAGEIGNRVPGFGEMIGFYAKAYEAAIGAIMELSDKKVNAMKPLVDRFRVISCPQPDWNNKSLDQILETKWNQFMSSTGAVVIENRLTDNEQEKLKEYFKQKITSDILSCCLQKIAEEPIIR